jgi:hypothetical protein
MGRGTERTTTNTNTTLTHVNAYTHTLRCMDSPKGVKKRWGGWEGTFTNINNLYCSFVFTSSSASNSVELTSRQLQEKCK